MEQIPQSGQDLPFHTTPRYLPTKAALKDPPGITQVRVRGPHARLTPSTSQEHSQLMYLWLIEWWGRGEAENNPPERHII